MGQNIQVGESMYTSASGDTMFFVAAFVAGAAIAFLYDLIRISRRIVPTGTSAVGIEDILFFTAAAVILFYAAYVKNHGEIRWQGFLGCAVGTSAYWWVLRNRFVNLGTTIIKWLIKSSLWLLKVVGFPVKIVLRALKKPIDIIAWYTGSHLRRARQIARCGKAKFKMRAKAARSLIKKR